MKGGEKMHIEKYKSQSIGNMINHYRRECEGTLKRENIDRMKTHLNYEIGTKTQSEMSVAIRQTVKRVESETGRAVRKDANLLADLVLTKPANVPEVDSKRFFVESAKFIIERLRENGLSADAPVKAYVHLDESTPHMHLAIAPVINTERGLSFNFKKVFPRAFYKTLHQDLQKHLTSVLGYEPQLLREGDDKLKSLSKLDQEEYKRVKDEVRAQIGELKEQKTQAQAELGELLDEKKALKRRLKACEEPLPTLKMNVLEKLKDKKKQAQLQKELNFWKEKLEVSREECRDLKRSVEHYEDKNNELEDYLTSLQSRLQSAKMKLTEVSSQRDKLKESLENLGLTQMLALEKELKNYEMELNTLKDVDYRLFGMSLESLNKELQYYQMTLNAS